MGKRFCFRLMLVFLLLSSSLLAANFPDLKDFDAYVQKVMSDWKVPGAAIVIVKDGKVILSKGYGLRDVKNNLPVTEQTLFPIASITKSFTVAYARHPGQRRETRLGQTCARIPSRFPAL